MKKMEEKRLAIRFLSKLSSPRIRGVGPRVIFTIIPVSAFSPTVLTTLVSPRFASPRLATPRLGSPPTAAPQPRHPAFLFFSPSIPVKLDGQDYLFADLSVFYYTRSFHALPYLLSCLLYDIYSRARLYSAPVITELATNERREEKRREEKRRKEKRGPLYQIPRQRRTEKEEGKPSTRNEGKGQRRWR